jgi:hypothetical protein
LSSIGIGGLLDRDARPRRRSPAGRDRARRGWSDREFIGVRVSLEVTGVEERDGATVITAQVGGDGFNGPSHFSFRVQGEKLARMTIRE